MNDTEIRAELAVALRELCDQIPQMRVAQLMAAIGELCADLHGRGLWEATDAEFLEAIWKFRHDFETSVGSAAGASRSQSVSA